jgi:vanillate O-demethylase monooxygenase subunit
VPVQNEYGDNAITVWRWIRKAPPIPLFANFGQMTGDVDRWHYYNYTTPCFFDIDMGSAVSGTIEDANLRHQGVQMHSCHVLTPVDERTVLQHWFHVRNFRVDDHSIDEALNDSLDMAFNEDKIILERIQLEEERNSDQKRIVLGIDAAPRRMRKMVARLIETEKKPVVSGGTMASGLATGHHA